MLDHRIAAAVAAAAAAVAGLAGPALADDDQSVLVVPLAGELHGDLERAPHRMDTALEKAVAAAGLDGVLAQVPRDELAAVAGCAKQTLDCFLQVAETLGANGVIVGEIAARDGGGLDVTLSIGKQGGKPRTVEFAALGDDLAAIEADFQTKATAFLRGEEIPKPPKPEKPEPKKQPEPKTKPEPRPMPDPIVTGPEPETDDGFSLGRVKGYSWGIAGGGLAVAATGVVFLGIANGKQSDVDDHPTDTVEDLEALAELEDDGKRYNRIGNGMVIVGGVATAVGLVLIIKQGRDAPEERPTGLSVAPMPLRGGAGVMIGYDGWSF